MQILQPLAVGNIRFATRHVFHMTRVDQQDRESSLLENLEQRNPIDSRRFHRYALDLRGLQQICGGGQVFGESREAPHWWGIARRRPSPLTLTGASSTA